jgi:isocitrate/isopropylmalate dehydrogenase
MSGATVVVLDGDQTGQELLREALRVLDASVIGFDLQFQHFDLGLEHRRSSRNGVVHEAAAALREAHYGLKAATITPEGRGDVGSPNAILREEIDGKVILRTGRRTRSKVFGGPKYTVSPVYEGMLKEEMDAAHMRYPDVRYDPQLIDATYALLLNSGGEALTIPALNRDGDCLSDLVLQMFGSVAGSESLILSFDAQLQPSVVVAEAPHGTAPSLQGKNIANPMAMILAGASLLTYLPDDAAHRASRAIYEAVFEAIHDGIRTADLGGHALTDEFTDSVVERVRTKLEVWASMGTI